MAMPFVTLDTEPPVSELLVTYSVLPSDRPNPADRLYLQSRLGVLTCTGSQSSRINHSGARKKGNSGQLLFLGKLYHLSFAGSLFLVLVNYFLVGVKID